MTPLMKARLEIASGVLPIVFCSKISLIGGAPPAQREEG
jgi:hypothetical protein